MIKKFTFLILFFGVLSAPLLNGQTVTIDENFDLSTIVDCATEIVVPCGVAVEVTYEIWGGGGAGGRFNSANTQALSGGGGGGYSTGSMTLSGGTYAVVCGAGGVLADALDTNNAHGTSSSFNGIVSTGGRGAGGGNTGGAGGTGTTTNGGIGGNRSANGSPMGGGGGGGSGPTATNGMNGVPANGGAGGMGTGAGGDGGNPTFAGMNGTFPGGGGGGKGDDAGGLVSGAGADGLVRLTFSMFDDQSLCYPATRDCAEVTPGEQFDNTTNPNCAIDPVGPTELIMPPVFACENATAVSYMTPVFPEFEVLYQYWGVCSVNSPDMPDVMYTPQNNGFIQQFFCTTDINGLPAFPDATNETGTLGFLPEIAENIGTMGFAVNGTCTDIAPGETTTGEDGTDAGDFVELIQLDFWLAVPAFQPQVGIQFFSDTRQDAGSLFIGPGIDMMCEVAYYTDGDDHMAIQDQLVGTYNIDPDLHDGECGYIWLRVREYITDIRSKWGVKPQINVDGNWVDFATQNVVAATSPDDNVPPTALDLTAVACGYKMTVTDPDDGSESVFIFDDQGAGPDLYACMPVDKAVDAGICLVPCDPAAVMAAIAPEVIVTESECISPATTPSGGVIDIPTGTCPDNSSLEYSIDGVNFTTELPMYDQSNPVTVTTRCVCDDDPDVVSVATAVTTMPAVCCNPDCGDFPANPAGN